MRRMSGVVTMAVSGGLIVAAGLVQGCRSAAPSGGSDAGSGRAGAVDPKTLGELSGTVHFVGKAPVPVKIDTSMDPACAGSGSADFNAEQYVVNDGGLGNVYVYMKSGPPIMGVFARGVPAAVLDQKGCRYTPHVVAVMIGGGVEFRNSDPTMHNIHTMPAVVGNEAIDVSQGPKGAPVLKRFMKPEVMMPVRCNNHPWMNAFINVSATPFFAVSDAAGHFAIKGLPAGEYVFGAVHEKLGEQTVLVTIPANGAAKGDFTYAMK